MMNRVWIAHQIKYVMENAGLKSAQEISQGLPFTRRETIKMINQLGLFKVGLTAPEYDYKKRGTGRTYILMF